MNKVGGGKYFDLPEIIDVLIAGDKRVYEGLCLCALSIAVKTKTPVRINLMTSFALNTDGITKSDADYLEERLKLFNPLNSVNYIDATADYENFFSASKNAKPVYSPCSLLRLLAERYISSKRLIYLDTDTMCVDSLEEFFRYDISNVEFGAVLDYMGKFWVKKDYFNSGVMFFNMELSKSTKLFEKAKNLLMEKRYFFADQSALYNASTKRLYLPVKFNEQRDIKADTVVKHFNKGIQWIPYFKVYNVKQWQRDKVHGFLKITRFDDIYELYDKLFTNADGEKNENYCNL